jgi:hypothetical protein
MTSFTGGNCSSTLCNIITGSLVGRYYILLCKLNVFITHGCVLMNVVYMNFSDMESKPVTGYIKQGIFAFALKEIILIVSVLSTYHTLWKVLLLVLKRRREI